MRARFAHRKIFGRFRPQRLTRDPPRPAAGHLEKSPPSVLSAPPRLLGDGANDLALYVEQVLEAVMECCGLKVGGKTPSMSLFITMDCRVFYEHHSTLRSAASWNHSGYHPANVQRIQAHRSFAAWNAAFMRQLELRVEEGRPLFVVLYCKSGRDRSVGCARILETRLQESGYIVDVQHACLRLWRHSGKTCWYHACVECFGAATAL